MRSLLATVVLATWSLAAFGQSYPPVVYYQGRPYYAHPPAEQPPPARVVHDMPWRPEASGRATTRWADGVTCLDQINRQRAAYGLDPYVHDDDLTKAALGCVECRAATLNPDHLSDTNQGDFRFLPGGFKGKVENYAAGCAAWPEDHCLSSGFGACAMYDGCRLGKSIRAGAAWCRGRDGRRYMHLFILRP